MSEQLFIRVRGRVQGPFDHARLRGLARRGAFGRLHEVSEDGTHWVRASEYPQLFAADEGNHDHEVELESANAAESGAESIPLTTGRTADPAPSWFYLIGSQQFGPVDRSELNRLAQSGQIGPHSQVWTKGMPGWMPAAEVSQLGIGPQPHLGTSFNGPVSAIADQLVTDAVYGALLETRPWVLLFAIVGLLSAAFSGLAGLITLFLATKRSDEALAGQGIGSLLQAGVVAWVSCILLRYAGRIQAMRFSRSSAHLEEALRAQRDYWRISGSVLVVLLAIALIVLVWIAAAM